MKIDERAIVIILIIATVYIWTCYTMGERRPRRHNHCDKTAFLFGRAYYSRAVLEWLGHGTGHARKMTGKELAQYEYE